MAPTRSAAPQQQQRLDITSEALSAARSKRGRHHHHHLQPRARRGALRERRATALRLVAIWGGGELSLTPAPPNRTAPHRTARCQCALLAASHRCQCCAAQGARRVPPSDLQAFCVCLRSSVPSIIPSLAAPGGAALAAPGNCTLAIGPRPNVATSSQQIETLTEK